MESTDRNLELSISLAWGDPLRGSLRLAEGEPREFWGWLELAELITRARDDAGATPLGDRSVGD